MHLDARKLDDGTVLETEICVVGSGPAGITVARGLEASGSDVLVLESGGRRRERHMQKLNVGEVVGGSYGPLESTRHRQMGGTANVWNTPVQGMAGAKYAPLDAWDFMGHPDRPLTEWPIGASHMEPYYVRAQQVCGLGPFLYEGSAWATTGRPCLGMEGGLATRVYQFGRARIFTRDHLADLEKSPRVRLCFHATVRELETDPDGGRVASALVATRRGRGFTVRARWFVLASGGVENARLLLLSGRRTKTRTGGREGLGNRSGWVGRCFMEHPRDYSLTLTPYGPRLFSEARFFDPHQARDGTVIGGRLGLKDQVVLGDDWPRGVSRGVWVVPHGNSGTLARRVPARGES